MRVYVDAAGKVTKTERLTAPAPVREAQFDKAGKFVPYDYETPPETPASSTPAQAITPNIFVAKEQ